MRHGGHLLALGEASSGYEMTMELDTLGAWKAGTDQPIRNSARTTGATRGAARCSRSPTA